MSDPSSLASAFAGNPAVDISSSILPIKLYTDSTPGPVNLLESLSPGETISEIVKPKYVAKATGERLEFARPRSTSNDITNRGQHGYLRLKGSSGKDALTKGAIKAETNIFQDSIKRLTAGTGGEGYDKFLITGVTASMDEKVQIMEVFGDTEVAYYFGRAPMMFVISGTLIDSKDNSWFADWLYTYSDITRGSKLAQRHEQVSLVMPNMTLTGAMHNTSWEQNSISDVSINFRFTMLVTDLVPTPAMAIGTAITDAANFIDFSKVSGLNDQSEINKLKSAEATLKKATSSIASKAAAFSAITAAASTKVSATLGAIGGSVSDGGLFASAKPFTESIAASIDGLTSKVTAGLTTYLGPNSYLGSISSKLSTIRANLFLPVYGVMNSLTKLVGAVFGANGISALLSGLTAPIRNILGDITSFANQATAISNMITSGVADLGRNIKSGFGITQSFDQASRAVSQASGTLAALPQSIGDSIRLLVNGGNMSPGAAFLQSNPKASLSRTPATLNLSGSKPSNLSAQLSILSRKPAVSRGAYL